MLFESLDKLKMNSILSSIIFITLGTITMIIPVEHVDMMILVLGYAMIIFGIVVILNFLTSKKSLMDCLVLMGAIAVAIAGICVVLFREDVILVLAWMFGILLILEGLRTLHNSLIHARLSGRKAWWVLTIMAVLLMAAGIVLIIHPGVDTPNGLLKVIGGTVFFAAIVSVIRLIWTWPIKRTEEEAA